MMILIKDMTAKEYEELCTWARVGANNSMIGHKSCIELPPHGRLIDADALRCYICEECNLYPDKCLERVGEECDRSEIYHIDHCAPTIIEGE